MKTLWRLLVLPLLFLRESAAWAQPADCGSAEWTAYEGSCYLLVAASGGPLLDWYSAEELCNLRGGHSLSVHGQDENDFVFLHMEVNNVSSLWSGMSTLGLDSGFEWTDGTALDFTGLDRAETGSDGRCVAFQQPKRSWSLSHCSELKGAMCKRWPAGVSTRSPVTAAELPGHCPEGWTRADNKCLALLGTTPVEREDWVSAKKRCRTLGLASDLASVHSLYEQAVLITLLTPGLPGVWLGLSDKGPDSEKLSGKREGPQDIFVWTDNSGTDFTYWAPGKPSTQDGICVEMSAAGHSTGRWRGLDCNQRRAFACQTKPDVSAVTEGTREDDRKCPRPGFLKFGEACYGVFRESALDWHQAEESCRKTGAHLASILGPLEQAFVHTLVNKIPAELWIGLSDWPEGKFRWSDGWHVAFANWVQDEPGSQDDGRCVALDPDLREWRVRECSATRGHVCKISAAPPAEEPSALPPGTCPDHVRDWSDVGLDHCYLAENGNDRSAVSTWGEANYRCSVNGSVLASFHSQEELNRLQPIVQKGKRHLWIGMIKKFHGGFEWTDDSPVDFVKWGDGFPSNASTDDAVVLTITNMTWKNVKRSSKLGYLCMIAKGFPPTQTSKTVPVTPRRDDADERTTENPKSPAGRMRAGGIAVISVGALLALLILAVSVLILAKVRRGSPGGVFPCERKLFGRGAPDAPTRLLIN